MATIDPKVRKCLRCQKLFLSESSGNRLCGRCTSILNRMVDLDKRFSSGHNGRVVRDAGEED